MAILYPAPPYLAPPYPPNRPLPHEKCHEPPVDFGEAFPLEGHGSFEPGYKFISLLDEDSQLTRINPSVFIFADLSQQFLPQRHKVRHTS